MLNSTMEMELAKSRMQEFLQGKLLSSVNKWQEKEGRGAIIKRLKIPINQVWILIWVNQVQYCKYKITERFRKFKL